MEKFERFSSHVVALPNDDVDTDQIIPARYLKITDRENLGAALFADWRYDASGAPIPDFPLNRPESAGSRVLVAGRNFGCGSSREHAPWALVSWGFRAVVGTTYADIFRSNAIGNALLPIALEPAAHARLLAQVTADPSANVTIDLAAQSITFPSGEVQQFPIDAFDRYCLLNGVDRLGFLLDLDGEIARFEEQGSGTGIGAHPRASLNAHV